MFENLRFSGKRPVYLQIKDYIKKMILTGLLQPGVRLPSTRELAGILQVSRNTVLLAYQYLEDDGLILQEKGRGAFVSFVEVKSGDGLVLDWEERVTDHARLAAELDIEKKELKWEKGMISFKSIAPDPSLFGVDDFKKSFLQRFALEGAKLLNYGYAKGYKQLMEYIMEYMKNKGLNPAGKDIMITNGFTEGFNLVLSALLHRGDRIVCENPTHNTAIKIMKLSGLRICGVEMRADGISIEELKKILAAGGIKAGFLIPSYHNPTGLVMSPEKRVEILKTFTDYQVPIIEDGFNEELRFSGSHVAPLIALAGKGNGVIYIGSFSKILFPGMRIGWVIGDVGLISYLESVKRSANIHTSFLDQAILYEYLQNGYFERYLKKARKVYKERHEIAVRLAQQYIPATRIWGEGGLHIFIELAGVNARTLLRECYKRNVLYMPGDVFYTNGGGENAFRLGISRVNQEEIETGMKIIGEMIQSLQ